MGLEQGTLNLDTSCDFKQLVPSNLSFQNRPELKGLDAEIEAAEAGIRQAKSAYYPSADIYASYQFDKGYELNGDGDSWMAGVRLNYNIFDGRRTSAGVAKASAYLTEKKEQKRKVELAINFEVEQALLFQEEAEQRLQVTAKMVEQAEESAKLSRERFKEGVVLSSDLIDVENRLTDAQVRKTVALASQRIAIADLRRAVGMQQFDDVECSTGTSDLLADTRNDQGRDEQ
jgi:outer membrane protein TolC